MKLCCLILFICYLSLGALDSLRNLEELEEMYELYKKYMRPLLQDISSTPEIWTVHCSERLIFQTLILNSGENYL